MDVRGNDLWQRSRLGGRRAHRGIGVTDRSQRPVPSLLRGAGAAHQLYAAGLSSRTIIELLPCTESPSEENSDAALARMAQERDRLSEHIADLIRTRDTLDELMAVNRAHRETLRTALAS
jgi:hypothetical protein